jgi:hypothetical protein
MGHIHEGDCMGACSSHLERPPKEERETIKPLAVSDCHAVVPLTKGASLNKSLYPSRYWNEVLYASGSSLQANSRFRYMDDEESLIPSLLRAFAISVLDALLWPASREVNFAQLWTIFPFALA